MCLFLNLSVINHDKIFCHKKFYGYMSSVEMFSPIQNKNETTSEFYETMFDDFKTTIFMLSNIMQMKPEV